MNDVIIFNSVFISNKRGKILLFSYFIFTYNEISERDLNDGIVTNLDYGHRQ